MWKVHFVKTNDLQEYCENQNKKSRWIINTQNTCHLPKRVNIIAITFSWGKEQFFTTD